MRREPAGPIRSRKKNFRETAPAAQTLAAKLASLVTAQQEDTVHAAMETPPAVTRPANFAADKYTQLAKDRDLSAPDEPMPSRDINTETM